MSSRKPNKKYEEINETKGQRVINGGTEISMINGRRFKRIVLPSIAERKKSDGDDLIDEALGND